MQALQGPTPDGGNLPDAPLVDDPTQNKIMQALSRAVTLRTNSKDTKPDDWAKAQGMYRDMDLGDAVLRGEMTPAAVGSSQAAVGAKPLVHADSSGLVTNLFSGAQNDPTRVHVVTEKERQLGNQAKAGAAENYAQAKNANASAAKTTKELELLATGGGKGSLTSPKDRFEAENKLRDEYQKQAGTFIKIRDAYNLVQAGAQDPSAAGDLSLIFAYMRILDPNSVVREGEFATAQNATGVPDRLRNIYNRALNGERLSKEQRADFVGRAKKIYDTTAASQAGVDKTYNDLAGRYGLDVNNIVTSYQVPQAPQPQPAQPGVAPKGLTAEEQAELDALRKRFGKTKP